jgi:hypothetical protein
VLSAYISSISAVTYFTLWSKMTYMSHDHRSVLFLPMRWTLYCCTMPAIWWIVSHISTYSLDRRLYVFWLNWVMLISGGLATIPGISWGHKVFWMAVSCIPFPELCFHMWCMISDAISTIPPVAMGSSSAGLHFLRVYGQFCYQFFPAIYFAAFDGCLPLSISEPLWSLCDWCLKMVMTSSLMEADFFTINQARLSFCVCRLDCSSVHFTL